MDIQTVEQARAAFHRRHASKYYSGPLHLATTVGISLLVASLSAMMLEKVTPLEWVTIPLTFLYANLSEYLGHRGPMHNKTRFLSEVFKRHSIEHHSFFTHEAATFDSSRDYKAVLFPPILLAFFLGCFAIPVGAILYVLVSPNVCFLFVLTAILYFLNYELLHFVYHMDPQSMPARLPFMGRLRRHHINHHNKSLMTRYNFNITYPIFDRILGTIYDGQD